MSRKNKHKQTTPTQKGSEVQNSSGGTSNILAGFTPFSVDRAIFNIRRSVTETLITNQPKLISDLWAKDWIAKSTIELPIRDAFKDNITIKTDLASDDEVSLIEKNFAFNMLPKLINFFFTVRAFGSAYLIINPLSDKASKPLSDKITQQDFINCKSIDMMIASNYEFYDNNIQNKDYQWGNIDSSKVSFNDEVPYMYYGRKVHRSRVIRMINNEPPRHIKERLNNLGGLSVLEGIMKELEQLYRMRDGTHRAIEHSQIDVLAIDGYSQGNLEGQGVGTEGLIKKKLEDREIGSALVIDRQTTDYQQKQLNLSSFDRLLNFFQMQVLQATGIPPKRVAGLNTTGFSDSDKTIEEFYNRDLMAIQVWAKPVIKKMVDMLFLKEYGNIPSDLDIEYKPLNVPTEEEKQALKNQKLDNILKINGILDLSSEQLRDLLNAGDILDKKLESVGLKSEIEK